MAVNAMVALRMTKILPYFDIAGPMYYYVHQL